MLNLAWPCQQFIGGQPLSNESININLDIDNLDFIHLDFHHLETLVHKLPNSPQITSSRPPFRAKNDNMTLSFCRLGTSDFDKCQKI